MNEYEYDYRYDKFTFFYLKYIQELWACDGEEITQCLQRYFFFLVFLPLDPSVAIKAM